MPGCRSRSAEVPAPLKDRMEVILGTLGNGASTTVRPLASFFSVIFGRLSGRAAPGGGGVFCCAIAVAVNRIIASSVFIFITSLARLWLRLGFRNAIDHGAIGCHQIFRRRCFNLRYGDVLERSQQRIDLLWIV